MASPEHTTAPAFRTAISAPSRASGGFVALMGSLIVVAAWLMPVIEHHPPLLAEEKFANPRWFWEFLVPLGIVVLASGFSFWVLVTRARWPLGALVGVGLMGAAHFAVYLVEGLWGGLLGAGSVVGLLGAGTILMSGFLARGDEDQISVRSLGPWVTLAGTLLVVMAWFLPTAGLEWVKPPGRFVALGGVPIDSWLVPFLQPLFLVVVAATVGVRALLGPIDRILPGIMIGCGMIAGLYFLALFGIGDENLDVNLGRMPVGAWVGVLGAAIITVGGVLTLKKLVTQTSD